MKTPLPLLLATGFLAACPTLLKESAGPPGQPVLDLPPAIGAGDDWWARASEAIARSEYEVTPVEGGFRAPNRAQNLHTWYRYDGAEVTAPVLKPGGEWIWKWRTLAWGRPEKMLPAATVAPRAKGTRVEYPRVGMVEWYENRREGVEQGFTVTSRPAGAGPLRLEGAISPGLRARLSADGDAVSFADRSGAPVLRYSSLVATDARGRKLDARLEVSDGVLAIQVDDRGAVYPLTIDPLMTSPNWTAESDQTGANLGCSVASAGDVNGDGYTDIIVGAYHYDNGETDEGRAFVFLGTILGPSSSWAWKAEGNQAQAFFGESVASAGDVNGDGYDDVIVGAQLYDGGETDEGRAYLYLGSATGLSTSPAWIAESNQPGACFGNSVASAGDVNGDGYDDVIVGAHHESNGQTTEGRAYLYLGSASGLGATAAWTAESNQAFAYFGESVASAGDVNGDGFADVIVGAHQYSNGQGSEGRAFVYLGSYAGLGASAVWTAESNQSNAFFGKSVASAGDVNGDGYADVIVGAYGFDNGESDEGRAFVYIGSGAGLSPTPVWTAECNVANAAFGWSVAGAGDINGDGYGDVIIGAYAYNTATLIGEGRVFVYDGSAAGLGGVAWSVEGGQGGAFFGWSVASAGDVNGDGYADVIVGAYAFDDGESDEGGAYVFHGAGSGLPIAATWTGESNQAHSHFGFCVAPAGDVNGDGFPDVIIGAPWFDAGQFDEGRAYVYLGSVNGLRSSPAWFVESDQDSALFGYSVAGAGDVNHDGYADVIVGAYQYDNGQTDEGRAFVYLGSPVGLSHTPAWTAESDQADARFGYSVAGAGDVNGDGFSDVIVGAHRYDHGQTDEGRAFVYLGSASGLSATPAWTAESDQGGADFGDAVAGAGDVNHDGYSDVIVGARTYDHGETNEGRAFVFLGSAAGLAPTPAWTAESDQVEARFGFSVASAGDVNGDGYDDVIVGAYLYDDGETDEGRAYVYCGSATGLSATPVWTAESNQAGADFGCSVATAGDVNRDGYDDVIVGAFMYDAGEVDEGAAFVYRGSPYGLGRNPAWLEASGQAGAWAGCSVAGVGDVNGDHFPDVVVGAHKFDAGQDNEGRTFVYYNLRTSGATTAVMEPVAAAPTLRFDLVYPNPSRAQSVLRYVLPRSGPVRLSIHDVLGRRVAMLADRVEEAGSHSVRWEGRDARGATVPAGVYWARLESGGAAASQKLVRSR